MGSDGGKLRKDFPVSRMIPMGGITITPKVVYHDYNDMPDDFIEAHKQFFYEDSRYSELRKKLKDIRRGQELGRTMRIFVSYEDKWIGSIEFREYLDNPDGYGKGDFMMLKWIYPEFRNTKYSRYASADMIHLMFRGGIAKRLYSYSIVTSFGGNFYQMVDRNQPCLGKVFDGDGDLQRYFFIRKQGELNDRKYVLIEFNGEVYLNMDLPNYVYSVSAKTTPLARIAKWMQWMDDAAEVVGRTLNGKAICPVL